MITQKANDAVYAADEAPTCSNNKSDGYGGCIFDVENDNNVNRAADCSSAYVSEIEELAEGENMAIFIGATDNGKVKNRLDLIREDEISRLVASEASEEQDMVYVAVSKRDTSMDALLWAISNAVNPPTTTLYLIHVFPELKWVPNPLGHGKVPRSQVSKEQVDKYLEEETNKRRQFLNKFMDKCNAHKVTVETILIESDMEAKAILELVSVLNVKKLVLGVSKSDLRKMRSRKGTGVADQLLQKAPEWCEIKFICEGKDAFEEQTPVASTSSAHDHDRITHTPSPRLASNNADVEDQPSQPQHRNISSFPYCCFKG